MGTVLEQPLDDGRVVVGHMKWFDPGRGFGFLVDDAGGQDVLVHGNVVRKFGQGSLAEGTRVVVEVAETDRGRQATRVVSIDTGSDMSAPPIADLCNLSTAELMQLPPLPARVKWFDRAKGFGFANVFGRRDDVFLHIEVVRHCGFADLIQGEAIGMRVVDGRRGLMAAQLFSWDRATEDDGLGDGGNGPRGSMEHPNGAGAMSLADEYALPDDWNRGARRARAEPAAPLPRCRVPLAAQG
ncbi:cold shock domain-containing protein [uncultured Paracoccus sp.]|uniref:cold-shock protein n=1 Tax=uncultured Paracoccus sp. TaxID=189685 RepID=UPI003459647C